MARKRRRRSGGRDWIQMIFNILGITVAAGPAINVLVSDVPAGKWQSIPNDVLFAYTGLGGTTPINTNQTLVGVGAIVGGGIVASIPRLFRLVKRIFSGRR